MLSIVDNFIGKNHFSHFVYYVRLTEQLDALAKVDSKNVSRMSWPSMVLEYVKRYLRLPDDYAAKELASLKRPFREAYAITYHGGKQLLLPWVQGPDRRAVFRRFLREQIIPLELVRGEPVP